MEMMEERWQEEAVVALAPWGASLSMPQGQGSLLGHRTLSTSGVCQCSPHSPGPLSGCPVSPRS